MFSSATCFSELYVVSDTVEDTPEAEEAMGSHEEAPQVEVADDELEEEEDAVPVAEPAVPPMPPPPTVDTSIVGVNTQKEVEALLLSMQPTRGTRRSRRGGNSSIEKPPDFDMDKFYQLYLSHFRRSYGTLHIPTPLLCIKAYLIKTFGWELQ